MHVALLNLTRGGLSGGYRAYLRSLVPRLREDPRVRRLDVFVPPPALPGLLAAGLTDVAAWPDDDHRHGFRWLRAQVRDSAPDVVFVPSARLVDTGRPTVVMVRNMEPLERPLAGHTLRAGLVNLARASAARRACRRAHRIIAVSRHVAEFLTNRWHLDPLRVDVVSHGVEVPQLPSQTNPPRALAGLVAGRFLFTAGSVRPARGLEDVITAVAGLPDAPVLVIAGAADPDTQRHFRRMKALAARLGVADRILWPGWLDRDAMAWCFGHCAAFVMTSHAEACPNTVLEAMSHGCVSISTDQPPMPEFFGDTAVYYRAGDAGDLARRISSRLETDASAADALRRAARDRAAGFSWTEAARRTVDVLGVASQSG